MTSTPDKDAKHLREAEDILELFNAEQIVDDPTSPPHDVKSPADDSDTPAPG
jgi:hypothetical protein